MSKTLRDMMMILLMMHWMDILTRIGILINCDMQYNKNIRKRSKT